MSSRRVNTGFSPRNRLAIKSGAKPWSVADSWAAQAHLTAPARTVLVLVGHLGGFGLLWIAQFVILDRVVFAQHSPGQTEDQ